MSKVLRGGKWGSAPSRTNSRSRSAPSSKRNTTTSAGDEADNDQANESIVCFTEDRNQLSIACYEVSTNEIHVSKVPSDDDYACAARVVSSIDHCYVVLPVAYKDNDNLRKALRLAMRWEKTAPEENDSQSRSQAPVPAQAPNSSHDVGEAINDLSVSFIPNSEFGLGKAGELCALLTIVGMPQQLDPEGRMAFLSYVLGEDGSIIRTVGGLLSFILQNGVLGSISEDDETIHINAISHKNFCDVVQINRTTLLALHVFSHETHPVGRGSMKAKEGLSLFGIIKPHIKTVGGRSLLRSWLHYPTTNIDEIQQRQLLVQSLREGSNHAFLTTVKDALRGVKNVPGVIYRLRRVSADIGDWKALYSSTRSFIVILETLKVVAQQKPSLARSPVVTRAGSFEESHLRDIAGWMDAIIDFDESCASGKLVVAPGFSEEIDEMKRCYSGLDDFLTSVGVQELEKFVEQGLAQLLESLQFTYQPQIGYLVVLSEKSCDAIGFERLEGFGFSFVFSSADEGFHFKNDRCRELDEELGDIHGAILDLEAKAYRYLEEKVFECTVTLLGMSKVSIELDCLQALACSANEFSWTMPDISEEYDCLNIEEGRHALVELTVPSFVPNSTRMKFGDVHILTGPNYSGKSVYLTQVALITVLAQIGSCVPARSAKVPLVSRINSRVSSFESVTLGQSSFFVDSSQVATMLANSTGRTLNLLDEYGKGTAESNGMALLAGVLRSILKRPLSGAPLTFCTTHFVEILKEPLLPLSSTRLGFFSMEVMMGEITADPRLERPSTRLKTGSRLTSSMTAKGSETVGRNAESHESDAPIALFQSAVRTYRLRLGSICDESRALQCALEAGVPKDILERAAHIIAMISAKGKIENVVACERNNPRIKLCADMVRKFIADDSNMMNFVNDDESSALLEQVIAEEEEITGE